jgi:serine/threonine protein kinase
LLPGDLLGQGGFADVHAAQLADPLLGFKQPVAVKRLRPDVLKSPADLREFLTEANLLRKLAHRCGKPWFRFFLAKSIA